MALFPNNLSAPHLEGLRPEDFEVLEHQADRTMARRSLPGTLAYPTSCLLVGLSTPYANDFPLLVSALTGASLLIAALRFFLGLRFKKLYRGGRQRWRVLFISSLIVATILWSTLSSFALLTYGVSWTSFLALLLTTTLSTTATSVFAASRLLIYGFSISILGPHIVVGLSLRTSEGVWIAATMSLILVYVWIAGSHRHTELWRGLADAKLLDLRATEIEAERASAEAARDAQGQFLANMSHEIRTPLGGILGMSELLLTSKDPGTWSRYSRVIHSSAENLLTLVDDILDFSKIQAGKLDIAAIDFSLHRAIREVAELLTPRARQKGIQLELALADDLPDWLIGDSLRLRQVLINLIGNAIKFTTEGRVIVRAEPIRRDDGLWIGFEVQDTGIGIEEDAREELFAAFEQGDSSISRRFGGTGLGLSICQSIVAMQKGEIGFDSTVAVGSTFWFRIPFVLSKLPREEQGTDNALLPSTAELRVRRLTDCRLLLVEDNKVNQFVALQILESLHLAIDVASNGLEAMELLKNQAYDVILMDCEMPKLDGFETTRQIRRGEIGVRHTPIIAMTAHAMAEDREKCLSVGMDDYLAKPFQRATLVAVLDRWLDRETSAAIHVENESQARPAAPQSCGASGQLDPERIESLRSLRTDGVDVFAQIAGIFLDRAQTLFAKLHQALDTHDADTVRLCAHSLNGSSGNLGAMHLSELSREIELLALQGAVFDHRDKVEELEDEFKRVEVEIRKIVPDLAQIDA